MAKLFWRNVSFWTFLGILPKNKSFDESFSGNLWLVLLHVTLLEFWGECVDTIAVNMNEVCLKWIFKEGKEKEIASNNGEIGEI